MIFVVTQQKKLFDEIQTLIENETRFRLLSYAAFLEEVQSGAQHIMLYPILFDLMHVESEMIAMCKAAPAINGLRITGIIDDPSQRALAQGINAVDYVFYPFNSVIDKNKLTQFCNSSMATIPEWNEIQVAATQDAFITLTARLIGEKLDIRSIVSHTLEQTLPLFDGIGGAIWLTSPDGHDLHIESYLSMRPNFVPAPTIPLGEGLVGWAAKHLKTVHMDANHAKNDRRYSPEYDICLPKIEASFLILPLKNFGEVIGVLMICAGADTAINDRQISMLEGVTDLATSAIVNARLLTELRENATQQHALYEMSQQVAGGLDLSTTFKRALQWAERLCETEFALLWSYEPQQKDFLLRAAIGVEIPEEIVRVDLSRTPYGYVMKSMKAVVLHKVLIPPPARKIFNKLPMNEFRNGIIIPLRSQNSISGLLVMINKIGSEFTKADSTLLSTAGDMISIAVRNAFLHETTVDLMQERQRMSQQAIHRERLATVGRLTATLAHEINNPMQAIRGALTLALEDMSDIEDLEFFIKMSLDETERVVKLVNRMRQIYRPEIDQAENLLIHTILSEAINLAMKELDRQDVIISKEFQQESTMIRGNGNQLHLVFLSLLLNFSDSIGEIGGGKLIIKEEIDKQTVSIKFIAPIGIFSDNSWLHTFTPNAPFRETNISFGSYLSQDVISNHNGKTLLQETNDNICLIIQLPQANSNDG